ncbi:MAG: CBS domain-containing protein, partial [Candidatus Binatia bacterium]
RGAVVGRAGAGRGGISRARAVWRGGGVGGPAAPPTPLAQVMTRELVFTEPGEAGEKAMAKITRHRCRHLPVVDGERLVGVVSIGDLLKEISDEQTVEIRFLKEYMYSR